MWKEHLDLIKHLHERIDEFVECHHTRPRCMILSRTAFQWILSIFEEDRLLFGVSPIDIDRWTYDTDKYSLKIVIDEAVDDYDITIE